MPKFNSYPLASNVQPADSYLIWQDSTQQVKQVLSANALPAYQYLINDLAPGSAISLVTDTNYDVCGVLLTTGVWDVEGNINLIYTGATSTAAVAYIAPLAASPPLFSGVPVQGGLILSGGSGSTGITIPRIRCTVTVGPFVQWYVKTSVTFSGGTVRAYGSITAQQVG